jgi:lysophospholipase L1-like esterase
MSLHVSVRVARQERAKPSTGSKHYRNGLGRNCRNDLSCAISVLEGTLPTTPCNGFLMSLDRTRERLWFSSALTMFWPLCRLRLEGSIELQRDRLPRDPSPEWFRAKLHAIAQGIKRSTSADLALCSLAPIGEDLDSMNPFQRELNMQIRRFSTILQEVAADENIDYVGVYEAFVAQMRDSQRRAFSEFRFLPFYRDAFRTLVLRKSPDEVSRMNGWLFHTDGVHLNSRGGLIVADLVGTFIEK